MKPQRECGGCTACCTIMGVEELRKKMYHPCCHQGAGCTIYETRPHECRAFACNWLAGLLEGDERRRPDKLGLMFTNQWRGGKELLVAFEVWVGAATEPNARYLLSKLEQKRPIVLVYKSNRFKVLSPDPAVRQYLTDFAVRHAFRSPVLRDPPDGNTNPPPPGDDQATFGLA